jgi:hypothetical protein
MLHKLVLGLADSTIRTLLVRRMAALRLILLDALLSHAQAVYALAHRSLVTVASLDLFLAEGLSLLALVVRTVLLLGLLQCSVDHDLPTLELFSLLHFWLSCPHYACRILGILVSNMNNVTVPELSVRTAYLIPS